MGIAKPSPIEPPPGTRPAVFTPTTHSALPFTNGPPELPGLIAASVCIASITASVSDSASGLSGTGRFIALTMPLVTVRSGQRRTERHHILADLQLVAVTQLGHRQILDRIDLHHREIGPHITADDPARNPCAIGEHHLGLAERSLAAIDTTWLLVRMYPWRR